MPLNIDEINIIADEIEKKYSLEESDEDFLSKMEKDEPLNVTLLLDLIEKYHNEAIPDDKFIESLAPFKLSVNVANEILLFIKNKLEKKSEDTSKIPARKGVVAPPSKKINVNKKPQDDAYREKI